MQKLSGCQRKRYHPSGYSGGSMKQETLEDAPKAEGEQQIDAEADTEKKAWRRMQMRISAGFPA